MSDLITAATASRQNVVLEQVRQPTQENTQQALNAASGGETTQQSTAIKQTQTAANSNNTNSDGNGGNKPQGGSTSSGRGQLLDIYA